VDDTRCVVHDLSTNLWTTCSALRKQAL